MIIMMWDVVNAPSSPHFSQAGLQSTDTSCVVHKPFSNPFFIADKIIWGQSNIFPPPATMGHFWIWLFFLNTTVNPLVITRQWLWLWSSQLLGFGFYYHIGPGLIHSMSDQNIGFIGSKCLALYMCDSKADSKTRFLEAQSQWELRCPDLTKACYYISYI